MSSYEPGVIAQTLIRPNQLPLNQLAAIASAATVAGLVVILTVFIQERTSLRALFVIALTTIPAAGLFVALSLLPILRWPFYVFAALLVIVVPVYAYSDAVAILTAIDKG